MLATAFAKSSGYGTPMMSKNGKTTISKYASFGVNSDVD